MAAPSSVPRVAFARQLEFAGARDLLFNLVRAELTSRYKTATFGTLWFLLNPALMTAVLVAVFQEVIHLSIERYPVFVLAALLPWTFFYMGIGNATTSLTRSTGLIKRVRIPRALIPLSSILANLVHFCLAMALLLVVLWFVGVPPHPTSLLLLPIVIAAQTAFLAGIGVAASCLNVVYRDVEHMILIAIRIGFWATPIFYPFEYIPPRWRWLAMLNPMTGFIENYRALLVRNSLPDLPAVLSVTVSTIVFVVAGFVLFVRLDPSLDDYV